MPVLGDAILPGRMRLVWGRETLDGSNPTPVDLSDYLSAVHGAMVAFNEATALGADPTQISVTWETATINIYAWKITGAADGTLIASTNNAVVLSYWAIGPSTGRKGS